MLATGADVILKNYAKQPLETVAPTSPEFYSGNNTPQLPLGRYPVQMLLVTGNLVAGSLTITGIPSTAGFVIGMPVTVQTASSSPANATPPIPRGCYVTGISTNSVTVSVAPLATIANAALVVGLSVYYDTQGKYGQGPGGFQGVTQLYLGTDYVLRSDMPGGGYNSESAILEMITGGILTGGFGVAFGGYGGGYGGYGRGTLSASPRPRWSSWVGNCCVYYASGYGTGPVNGVGSTLPADLTFAANMQISWMLRNIPSGGTVTSETLQSYSYALHWPVPGEPPEPGSIRQIMSRYRDLSIGKP